ncbi:MAG: ABC transporter permease [Planctomycetes bacterium]|nr:ABC transporter permease [Planctomycetota bacterium]
MKTIFWKELREHARWTPMGIIPMVIVLVLKWQSTELIFDSGQYGNSLSLTSLVGLLAASIALCLGFVQTWSDQRPAARALLLHRGITADAAFCGKLLAGLLLYTVAVFGPLLGMAAFITSVGIEYRAASPSALIPSALIAIAAFSCWAAGLLMVQRNAWFFGSRLLPGLTAALAVFACGSLMDVVFWLATTIGIATLVVYLTTARTVFVNSGQNATGVARAGLTVALTVAILTMVLSVAMMVETYRTRAAYARAAGNHNQYTVEFGPDGEPWLTRSHYSTTDYKYEIDQAAKMLPDRSVRDQLQPVPADWKPLHQWSSAGYGYGYSRSRRFIHLGEASVPSGTEHVRRSWVLDRKQDAILVYAIRPRAWYRLEATLLPPEPIGTFGEMRNQSAVDVNGNFTIVTTTGVFQVPGNGTEVEVIYALPEHSKELFSEIQRQTDPQVNQLRLLLRFGDRVVLLETEHVDDSPTMSLGPVRGLGVVYGSVVQLPDALATERTISIARDSAEGGDFVGLAPNWSQPQRPSDWFRFAADGKIIEKKQFTVGSTAAVVVETGNSFAAFVPPGAFAIGFAIVAIENGDSGIEQVWSNAKAKPIESAIPVAFGLIQPLLGILVAVWAARRRRLDKRATRRWLWWAFFYGPCGSLAILAAYPRIVRESCDACREVTRIDVATCEQCGHSLDEVPKIGIEVFDQDQTTATAPPQPSAS